MRRDQRTLNRIERVDGGLHWKEVERLLHEIRDPGPGEGDLDD
jgi:hypothetical protein